MLLYCDAPPINPPPYIFTNTQLAHPYARSFYRGTGFENVYVRDAPLMLTHSVNGSVPICSWVAPVVSVGVDGNVTGIVVPHLLPPAV